MTFDCGLWSFGLLNVLIIPDKFKGTLTAAQAANAIARGWGRARPNDALDLLPLSDGGDGFGRVLSGLLGATRQRVKSVDAAHRPRRTGWWWEPVTKTAIVESASVIGLAMLPAKKFHPFKLDTFGLGLLLGAVAKRGARRCLVGIGGSATNDGGFGLARALGWHFLNRDGIPIARWTNLSALHQIRAPQCQLPFRELTVATDVQNPLLGRRGATQIYGPQKGLTAKDLPLAELCLKQLARVVKRDLGRDLAGAAGAGAAGGLGFGLLAFAGARIVPGFELFALQARLEKRLGKADLVLTAEGAIDKSTLMGKGVGQVARWCCELGIACVGLAGTVTCSPKARRMFTQLRALTELTTVTQAKTNAAFWLERLAEQAAECCPTLHRRIGTQANT